MGSASAAAAAAGDPTSYWFDAVEDDGLAGIDFSEFDPGVFSFDDGCFGDIDKILESISGDQSKPTDAVVAVEEVSKKEEPPENGFKKLETPKDGSFGDRERSFANGDGRYSKKPRNGGDGDWVGNRNSYPGRCERYREPCRRRQGRDWEESDRRRREGDYSRKRDRDWDRRDSRDRDWRDKNRDRENRGYWARDSSGKLVFKTGSWEADSPRDSKRARLGGLEDEKRSPGKEEKKEKPAEEQARKYQLDVLEQAKQKNTIAFLETGAGKTLIAVLLIKSLYNDMLKQDRKMLAIFLVPKVPLVYQVKG